MRAIAGNILEDDFAAGTQALRWPLALIRARFNNRSGFEQRRHSRRVGVTMWPEPHAPADASAVGSRYAWLENYLNELDAPRNSDRVLSIIILKSVS